MAEHSDVDLSTPDAECGSVEFKGWLGLYKDFPEEGWYMIKCEDLQGFLTWALYEEESEPSVIKWSNLESEYEPEWEEPEEEDFVIQDRPHGYEVSPGGDGFMDYSSAVEHVRMQCERDNFFPNVWFMDDHGGFRSISEEVFKEE